MLNTVAQIARPQTFMCALFGVFDGETMESERDVTDILSVMA
jgi:hypothetical protein